jgi:hypothetical protein
MSAKTVLGALHLGMRKITKYNQNDNAVIGVSQSHFNDTFQTPSDGLQAIVSDSRVFSQSLPGLSSASMSPGRRATRVSRTTNTLTGRQKPWLPKYLCTRLSSRGHRNKSEPQRHGSGAGYLHPTLTRRRSRYETHHPHNHGGCTKMASTGGATIAPGSLR